MKYINYHKKNELKAAVAEVTTRIPLRLWFILLLLFVSNIFVAVSSATYGAKLMSMERQVKTVSEDNKKLMEQMVAQQSLQNISVKAEELGLVKPTQVVYLDAPPTLTAAF